MGTWLKAITFLILIATEISAQGMWNEFEFSYESSNVLANFEIENLKNIILNDDDYSDPEIYLAASEYLYYYHKDIEKDFLLVNLNTVVNQTLEFPYDDFSWNKFYSDTYIKGLLGDESAIANMISIVQSYPYGYIKDFAIQRLAEAGIRDHYTYVKDNYLSNKLLRGTLFLYGKDIRYTDEVKSIFVAELKSMDPSDWIEITSLSDLIGALDKQLQIDLLNNYFETSSGDLRYNYFTEMNFIDREGQLDRTLFALNNERDENFRAQYFPNSSGGLGLKLYSERYYEPAFVYSLQQVPLEPGSLTFARRTAFMNELKPPQPDSIISINEMLEKLTTYIVECYSYEWIGNEIYKNELLDKISNAKKYLDENNLTDCFNEINSFQKSVEEVHSGAKRNNAEAVSVAGYKFLYHYAQYILDRLN
jgi:hypothetical protein